MSGCTFLIDLICLPLERINMVLGMDLLSANLVYISLIEKAIFIHVKVTMLDDVIPTLLEGAVSMINYFFEHNKVFLFVITKDSDEGNDNSSILIVSEFPNVFSEEVTSLPHKRKVELSIDLVLGARPVSSGIKIIEGTIGRIVGETLHLYECVSKG